MIVVIFEVTMRGGKAGSAGDENFLAREIHFVPQSSARNSA